MKYIEIQGEQVEVLEEVQTSSGHTLVTTVDQTHWVPTEAIQESQPNNQKNE